MDARKSDFPQLSYDSDIPDASLGIGLTGALSSVRRQWWLPLLGSLIGLALGIGYLASTPTLYKSSARILIDTSTDRYLHDSKIIDAPSFDNADLGSQVYILSSESIALSVINSLNLIHDPEFVGSPTAGSGSRLLNSVKNWLGLNDHGNDIIDPDVLAEQIALEAFAKRLNVYREDVPTVVTIAFESGDPNKAARIANAIADTYIAMTSEAKLTSNRTVSRYIQSRLTELKLQAEDAEKALRDYRIAHKDLPSSEQLTALNTQLTNARIAVAEAKARLDGVRLGNDGKINAAPADAVNSSKASTPKFALNNPEIVKLRSEYRDLTARAADLEGSLGPKHAAVVKLRKQIDELRTSIRDQEQLIADSYSNEYQAAKAREGEVAATVARLVGEAGTNGQEQVTLRQLEGSADTLRNLYNSFLQYNTMQTENIPVQNAHVITKALPPLQKSYKKQAAVFLGSIMVGLCFGAGAAVAREWAADVFRTSRAVEQLTGLYCVTLPIVRIKPPLVVDEHVLDSPYSRFAEALRAVKTAITVAPVAPHGAKVIGIVSSVPGEGKTTIATNLAALMVASSGARTLVIDCDVHLSQLSARLAPEARQGLIEALVDPSRIDQLISKRHRSGMDVLPCALPSRVPHAAEFLGAPRMEQLLASARKTYDYIIIEIAPIMSVVDVKLIERFIDSFIFVVEWGQTRRTLVLEALSEAQVIRERIISVVLNKADPVALRTLEAYKGVKFQEYYQSER
jgi:polysaccharide biosynthesis transport protein